MINHVKLFIISALVLSAGCSTIDNKLSTLAPEARVSDAKITSIDYNSIRYDFTITVKNKIAFPVKGVNITYSIFAEGSRIGTFTMNDGLDLAGNEEKKIHLSESIKISSLNLSFADIVKKNKIVLKCEGETLYEFSKIEGIELPRSKKVTGLFSGSVDVRFPSLPELAITKIETSTVDFLGADLKVTFSMKNMEPFPVTFSGMSYTVKIDDGKVARSEENRAVTLAANESRSMTVDMRINFIPIAKGIMALYKKGKALIDISGEMKLKSDSGIIALPFNEKTEFSLPPLPDVRLKGASFKNMDLEGVDVAFIYEIKNRSDRDLNFARITYSIWINNREIVKVASDKKISVRAKGTADVPMIHRVTFAAMAGTAASIYNGEKITVKVTGSIGGFMDVFDSVEFPLAGNSEFLPPKMPGIAYKDFKYKSAQLQSLDPSAEFSLVFEVNNPNAFPVTIQNINYSFTAAGKKIVTGETRPVTLKQNERKNITLPVVISGQEMIRILPDLKKSSTLKYQLQGKIILEVSGEKISRDFNLGN